MPDLATNVLYGDNLDILRRYLPDAAVDLVASAAATIEPADDGRRFTGLARGRRIDAVAPDQFRDILVADFLRLGLLDVVLRVVRGDLPHSGDELRRQLHLDALAVVEPESTRPDLCACLGHAFTSATWVVTSRLQPFGLTASKVGRSLARTAALSPGSSAHLGHSSRGTDA